MVSTITSSLDVAVERFSALSNVQKLALLLFACWVVSGLFQKRKKVPNVPLHGYKSWWEPKLFLQVRFNVDARNIIASGYKKFKGRPFVVSRTDVDTTLLPMKYLNELRSLPDTKMSGRLAQVSNLVPKWTGTAFMMESSLHFRAIQNKLTPELIKYLNLARSELDYGWQVDVPQPEDWTEVNPQHIMRMLIARISATVFVGHPLCRDPEWLRISIDFALDTFASAFIMRLFPPWAHGLIAHLLPQRYSQQRQLKLARKLVKPLMDKHRDAVRRRAAGEEVEEEDTLMHWMMDNATDKENTLQEMSDRQCILTLASIHTTTQGLANLLVDLCNHPEWFPVLREEIAEITNEVGKINETEASLRQWFPRLEKMDSFLTESQRIHPPIMINPTRVAVQDHTFKDGTFVPAGSKVGFPGFEHQLDPAVIPNPDTFDPMRNYRKRHSSPDQMNKNLAGQTHPDNLTFGFGSQACPGRQFAVAETKLILLRLISEYDFKLVEGKPKPKTLCAGDNMFLDPEATLMMRKRVI